MVFQSVQTSATESTEKKKKNWSPQTVRRSGVTTDNAATAAEGPRDARSSHSVPTSSDVVVSAGAEGPRDARHSVDSDAERQSASECRVTMAAVPDVSPDTTKASSTISDEQQQQSAATNDLHKTYRLTTNGHVTMAVASDAAARLSGAHTSACDRFDKVLPVVESSSNQRAARTTTSRALNEQAPAVVIASDVGTIATGGSRLPVDDKQPPRMVEHHLMTDVRPVNPDMVILDVLRRHDKLTTDHSTIELAVGRNDKLTTDHSTTELAVGRNDKPKTNHWTTELAVGRQDKLTTDHSTTELAVGRNDKLTTDHSTTELTVGRHDKLTTDHSTTELAVGRNDKLTTDHSTTELAVGRQDKPTTDHSTTELSVGRQDKLTTDHSTTELAVGRQDKPTTQSTIELAMGRHDKQTCHSDDSHSEQTAQRSNSAISSHSEEPADTVIFVRLLGRLSRKFHHVGTKLV